MNKENVCLLTGAAGLIGQKVISNLISQKKKVLALGEPGDIFEPSVLKNNHIRINTALPISNKSFAKHDVQFCFGDLSDISFLASIFSQCSSNNINIEYVIHLSANQEIQKTSPKAYHPLFGDTVNLLEVARAYWQSNKDTLKCFFFASDSNNSVNGKIVDMMEKISQKENFPIKIYNPDENLPIGNNYKGSTELSSLYRVISPLQSLKKALNNKPKTNKPDEKKYINSLLSAVDAVLKEYS